MQLFVVTTEALAAWSLLDLRLVCAWSAPDLRLGAWSALGLRRGLPGGCFSSVKALLALCEIYITIVLELCLVHFFVCLQEAVLCYSFPTAGAVAASSAIHLDIVSG